MVRRVALPAMFGMLIGLVGSAATEPIKLPGIKGADDRVLIRTTEYPWRAIGRVNKRIGGFCTGTVIGPAKVLTAAHCLWNKRTRGWLPARSLHFVAGYQYGEYVTESKVQSYQIAKQYRYHTHPTARQSASDWAVLNLTTDVSTATGSIPLWYEGEASIRDTIDKRIPILQAGYSQDKAHILTVHDGCRFVGLQLERLALHDCDAVKGDSGSPILTRGNGGYRLIAIHVATLARPDGTRLGVAIPATTIRNGTDAGSD